MDDFTSRFIAFARKNNLEETRRLELLEALISYARWAAHDIRQAEINNPGVDLQSILIDNIPGFEEINNSSLTVGAFTANKLNELNRKLTVNTSRVTLVRSRRSFQDKTKFTEMGRMRSSLLNARRDMEPEASRAREELAEVHQSSHGVTVMVGTVKWFDGEKGFGFIHREGGEDVFVHRSAIADENANNLRQGVRVKFILERGKKGPEAKDVSVQI